MPPVSTRDPCEILGPSSARCNSTYFEIAMSECRTPATALASGRQGPAAQRQLATRPADPPQLHLGPARGRRCAQGLVDSRSRPWSSRRARGRSAVGGGDREQGQGALHRREVGHGRPRRRWRRPGRVARATRGGDLEPGGVARGPPSRAGPRCVILPARRSRQATIRWNARNQPLNLRIRSPFSCRSRCHAAAMPPGQTRDLEGRTGIRLRRKPAWSLRSRDSSACDVRVRVPLRARFNYR